MRRKYKLGIDARQTPEARFAYNCDKLECDLQSKLYDEEKCVELTRQENNPAFGNPTIQSLLRDGCSWSEMWMEFSRRKFAYDQNFIAVSKYASVHNLLQQVKNKSKKK